MLQLQLESPAVQALSSCLRIAGGVEGGMRFEMRFQDPKKGAGITYSRIDGLEEEDEGGGAAASSGEVDVDVAELISYLPSR